MPLRRQAVQILPAFLDSRTAREEVLVNANAATETPYVIVVPSLLAGLITELAERMSKAMNEPLGACRRAVEASVLSQGTKVVQAEVTALENQAERAGWNVGVNPG